MKGSTLARVVGAAWLVGCADNPLSPSSVDPFVYWPEAEYRIDYWLDWHTACRSAVLPGRAAYIRPVINGVFIREVKPEHTCSYNPASLHIYIDPKQDPAGCMAHELGHAALHQAGNPCWRDYEHDLSQAP